MDILNVSMEPKEDGIEIQIDTLDGIGGHNNDTEEPLEEKYQLRTAPPIDPVHPMYRVLAVI